MDLTHLFPQRALGKSREVWARRRGTIAKTGPCSRNFPQRERSSRRGGGGTPLEYEGVVAGRARWVGGRSSHRPADGARSLEVPLAGALVRVSHRFQYHLARASQYLLARPLQQRPGRRKPSRARTPDAPTPRAALPSTGASVAQQNTPAGAPSSHAALRTSAKRVPPSRAPICAMAPRFA